MGSTTCRRMLDRALLSTSRTGHHSSAQAVYAERPLRRGGEGSRPDPAPGWTWSCHWSRETGHPQPQRGAQFTVSLNFGDVPTGIAAVGTVGTLAAALSEIRTERNRRLATDEELRAERHREQVRLVAAYLGSRTERSYRALLANNSPEPVYSVVVGLMFVQGAPGPALLRT